MGNFAGDQSVIVGYVKYTIPSISGGLGILLFSMISTSSPNTCLTPWNGIINLLPRHMVFALTFVFESLLRFLVSTIVLSGELCYRMDENDSDIMGI